MSHWLIFLEFALLMILVFRLFQMWRYIRSSSALESSVRIPTALEDWDAEFERATGKLPEGSPLTIARIADNPLRLSMFPGDVFYSTSGPSIEGCWIANPNTTGIEIPSTAIVS